MKIILDTNFLVYCAKQKIDYVSEISDLVSDKYELVVPEQVINELEKLKEKAEKWKDKEAANLALEILKAKKIRKAKINGKTTDESIINLAKKDKKNIVCTLDNEIRNSLRKIILVNKRGRLMLIR